MLFVYYSDSAKTLNEVKKFEIVLWYLSYLLMLLNKDTPTFTYSSHFPYDHQVQASRSVPIFPATEMHDTKITTLHRHNVSKNKHHTKTQE